jgi:hypothetical protein
MDDRRRSVLLKRRLCCLSLLSGSVKCEAAWDGMGWDGDLLGDQCLEQLEV